MLLGLQALLPKHTTFTHRPQQHPPTNSLNSQCESVTPTCGAPRGRGSLAGTTWSASSGGSPGWPAECNPCTSWPTCTHYLRRGIAAFSCSAGWDVASWPAGCRSCHLGPPAFIVSGNEQLFYRRVGCMSAGLPRVVLVRLGPPAATQNPSATSKASKAGGRAVGRGRRRLDQVACLLHGAPGASAGQCWCTTLT